MAAISPDADPEEMLPALAHNVVTNGYQASHSNEALEPTSTSSWSTAIFAGARTG